MITLAVGNWRWAIAVAGEVHVYGFATDGSKPSRRGRFQLFCGDESDPRLGGDNACELERIAVAAGATAVNHWYEP